MYSNRGLASIGMDRIAEKDGSRKTCGAKLSLLKPLKPSENIAPALTDEYTT